MENAINVHGDKLQHTTGQHGADIAIQRLDDLDEAALAYAISQQDQGIKAVDLGCGWGIQGVRFATLGIDTTLIDQLPPEQTAAGINGLSEAFPIRYEQADASTMKPDLLPANISILFSQRFIHYLPFSQAARLLEGLRRRLNQDARLFISASGLDTELGEGYEHRKQSIERRFTSLSEPIAEKHGIHEPVCLYQSEDLEHLGGMAGFVPISLWRSSFGNIKGVFQAK